MTTRANSAPCPKCGELIERRTSDPMLDTLTHLAECGVLELAVMQTSDLREGT